MAKLKRTSTSSSAVGAAPRPADTSPAGKRNPYSLPPSLTSTPRSNKKKNIAGPRGVSFSSPGPSRHAGASVPLPASLLRRRLVDVTSSQEASGDSARETSPTPLRRKKRAREEEEDEETAERGKRNKTNKAEKVHDALAVAVAANHVTKDTLMERAEPESREHGEAADSASQEKRLGRICAYDVYARPDGATRFSLVVEYDDGTTGTVDEEELMDSDKPAVLAFWSGVQAGMEFAQAHQQHLRSAGQPPGRTVIQAFHDVESIPYAILGHQRVSSARRRSANQRPAAPPASDQVKLRVQWVGYAAGTEDTQEFESELAGDRPDLVAQYWASLGGRAAALSGPES